MGGIFKGLAMHFDELFAIAASAGGAGALLEYLIVILVFFNIFKGPIALAGLALWRVKWGSISDQFGRIGAFIAGVFTLFDWTSWDLDIVRVLASLTVGYLFMQGYTILVRKLEEKQASA